MARIRTIKPEFFTSESICNVEPLARLLFISLWCEADREGKLLWKPKTLKIRYFPVDKCDIDKLGQQLIDEGMITIYTVGGKDYCLIPKFNSHQVINNRERESELPSPIDASEKNLTCASRVKAEGRKEGKGMEGKGMEGKEHAIAFIEFWDIYPKKTAREDAEKSWNKLNPNQQVFDLIKAHLAIAYLQTEKQFIPHPATYLNGKRWNDEIVRPNQPLQLSDINYGIGGDL